RSLLDVGGRVVCAGRRLRPVRRSSRADRRRHVATRRRVIQPRRAEAGSSQPREGEVMKHALRLPLAVVSLVMLASVIALHAAAGPPNHANRFEATITETNASVTNRIADLGVFQLINTGTGSVDGFGNATVMLSATQDRSVTPCGPGSWTNAAIRRIS